MDNILSGPSDTRKKTPVELSAELFVTWLLLHPPP